MKPTSSIRHSHHRRSVARGGGFAALVLACGALGSAAPALAERAAPKYPSSIVVIGHSGATGYDSTAPLPRAWGFARKEAAWKRNVWATGDNPKVKSVYSRVLARNPAVKGNNFNLASGETDVSRLLRQAQQAVLLKPTPELVVVHSVDRDIACDGSDPRRYKPFGAAFSRVLDVLAKGAPNARVLVVSRWSLDRQHLAVIEQITTGAERAANAGEGLARCSTSLLGRSCRLEPATWRRSWGAITRNWPRAASASRTASTIVVHCDVWSSFRLI